MNEALRYFQHFFAEINKKLQYFRKRRLFFYYGIFFNEHLNEEIIFTVPESSHFTFDELMDELLCVFFFSLFWAYFFSHHLHSQLTSIQRMCIFHSKSCFNVRVLFFRYKATWETISLLCLTYRLIEMFCWKCMQSRCDNALNSTISYPNIFPPSFFNCKLPMHKPINYKNKQLRICILYDNK